jgi:hypothetical protein
VQAACDAAKLAGARIAGKEAPVHPDTETTVEGLKARIQSVVDFLGTLRPEDFAAADTRVIELPFMKGARILAPDYLRELALPNFYFHTTTAYDILRHNGVDVGKGDYIGKLA